jgi:hypothetical protein
MTACRILPQKGVKVGLSATKTSFKTLLKRAKLTPFRSDKGGVVGSTLAMFTLMTHLVGASFETLRNSDLDQKRTFHVKRKDWVSKV